jgi:hypothetical protein
VNTAHKVILIALIVGAVLITTVPPYALLVSDSGMRAFVGYHFFAPHLGKIPAIRNQYFQIDLVRVGMEWVCLLVLTAALWLLTKKREHE